MRLLYRTKKKKTLQIKKKWFTFDITWESFYFCEKCKTGSNY